MWKFLIGSNLQEKTGGKFLKNPIIGYELSNFFSIFRYVNPKYRRECLNFVCLMENGLNQNPEAVINRKPPETAKNAIFVLEINRF